MNIDDHNSVYTPLERYRIEGETVVIELALDAPFDMYDYRDPSPLRMRDFNSEVEKYITDSIREIPSHKKIDVTFYFDKFSNKKDEIKLLKKSYYDFFNFEIKIKTFELKQKIIRGLKSLAVGFCFLFTCIVVTTFLKDRASSLFSSFFVEGLTVLGWVSLWSPIQVFLYEIWPHRETLKILERAKNTNVDFKGTNELPEPRKYI